MDNVFSTVCVDEYSRCVICDCIGTFFLYRIDDIYRNKRLLTLKISYRYIFGNIELNGTTRWKCANQACGITTNTDLNNDVLRNENKNVHSHSPYQEIMIERQIVNTISKRKGYG